MVDVADPKENLNAGDFVAKVVPVIYDVLGRGKTPLIVGGSTMWIQWLVKGVPDAPKATEFAQQESERLIGELEVSNRWEEAYHIALPYDVRIEKLAKNDWYRLRRYLEVALTLNSASSTGNHREGDTQSLTGERLSSIGRLDVRCFFLSEDRQDLYHIIDSRCEEMLMSEQPTSALLPTGEEIEMRGLFGEVTKLLLEGKLDANTPVAKAIGYRQVVEF